MKSTLPKQLPEQEFHMADHTNEPPDPNVPLPEPDDVPVPEEDEVRLPPREKQPPVKGAQPGFKPFP